MFEFGLFDAIKVGATGGAHGGEVVGVPGEFVGAGQVVEDKT